MLFDWFLDRRQVWLLQRSYADARDRARWARHEDVRVRQAFSGQEDIHPVGQAFLMRAERTAEETRQEEAQLWRELQTARAAVRDKHLPTSMVVFFIGLGVLGVAPAWLNSVLDLVEKIRP